MSENSGTDHISAGEQYDIDTHAALYQGKQDGLSCLVMFALLVLVMLGLVAGAGYLVYYLVRLALGG